MKSYENPYDLELIAEQEQAMTKFMGLASQSPRWDSDPDRFENELWYLGKLVPRAVEGFARLKPNLTYCETPLRTEDSEYERVSGQEAYERWASSQASPRGERNLSLQLRIEHTPFSQTTIGLDGLGPDEITISQDVISLDPRSPQLDQYVNFKNTRGLTPSPEGRRFAQEAAIHNAHRPQDSARGEYAPFEAKVTGEAIVAMLMGKEAEEVYHACGKIGLFQYALWQNMSAVASSLRTS